MIAIIVVESIVLLLAVGLAINWKSDAVLWEGLCDQWADSSKAREDNFTADLRKAKTEIGDLRNASDVWGRRSVELSVEVDKLKEEARTWMVAKNEKDIEVFSLSKRLDAVKAWHSQSVAESDRAIAQRDRLVAEIQVMAELVAGVKQVADEIRSQNP